MSENDLNKNERRCFFNYVRILFAAGEDIDELCPSMYSFHSDPNEKNILLKHFRDNGIETTVDRQAKKQRIRDWIQNSVIEEVDEEVCMLNFNSKYIYTK